MNAKDGHLGDYRRFLFLGALISVLPMFIILQMLRIKLDPLIGRVDVGDATS